MRTNLKALFGFTLLGSEGGIGTVEDFYLDDTTWRVKFMVVDIGAWITSRRVVTSTQSILGVDCDLSRFSTELTRQQVRESPEIDTEKHLGPQHEEILVRHYHLHPRWPEAGMFGIPPFLPADTAHVEKPHREMQGTETNLVVASEVFGCSVESTDGRFGILDDFMIDDTWRVGEIVVRTGGRLLGRKVWVPLASVKSVNWGENVIRLAFSHKTGERIRDTASPGADRQP